MVLEPLPPLTLRLEDQVFGCYLEVFIVFFFVITAVKLVLLVLVFASLRLFLACLRTLL